MSNNKQIKDGNGVLFTTKTTEEGVDQVNTPHVNVDSIPLADNAATEATLDEINQKTPTPVDGKVPVDVGVVEVTGPLTDAQLRASRVGVDSLVSGSKFTFSADGVNSTAANLLVGGIFLGTIESILDFPAISLLFYADQSCMVTIYQYIDADGLIPAGEPTRFIQYKKTPLRQSFPINGNYIKVDVENLGLADTTVLQLDTAFGVIDSGTQLNNNRIALNEVAGRATRSITRTTFSNVIASGVDPEFYDIIRSIGTGQTVSQANGNLILTAGTTANAETILRSVETYSGSMIARIQTILSSRIVNNNFYVELVDVIGDGLAATINSATSITVTIPNSPFTSANVGQGMYLGAYSGTGTFVPQRAVIASVAGNAVTYTVASMAAGSGTCSVFGWNYYQLQYTGTTATSANYSTQRRGWADAATAATINTTASPGHMAIMENDDGNAYFADQLVASSAAIQSTIRASKVTNLAEENTVLYLQIRMANGTTNPAGSTTWTVGMTHVEEYSPVPITINNIKPQGIGNTMPVTIQNGTLPVSLASLPALGAGTANIGNVANLFNTLVADVTSAAITTTTTTAAFTPAWGVAYQINIPVTVVTGTNPTLDVSIEESDDNGTNWYTVYQFPRITATGIYRSPMIPIFGTRVRYVQTVGGTTPSFTRAINRLQSNYNALPQRQLVDRTISLTTLNSTTPILLARDCGNSTQLVVNVGAITTTAPQLQLEGSDDFGATWYAIGTPITAVASSTVQVTVTSINAAALRARVSTAGVGVTPGYVMIKAHD